MSQMSDSQPVSPQVEQATPAIRNFFGSGYGRLNHFAKMLADEGELRGLIGPRELPRIWSRHIVNSAAILRFLPEDGWVADIGSGAGFPGIVGAIMRPDLQFNLVEPMAKRCEWLDDVRLELGLRNVHIHNCRAQELDMYFACVTARAVADLKKLVPWVAPLVGRKGRLVLLKGKTAREEAERARKVFEKCGFNPPWVHQEQVIKGLEPTFVVDARKRWN